MGCCFTWKTEATSLFLIGVLECLTFVFLSYFPRTSSSTRSPTCSGAKRGSFRPCPSAGFAKSTSQNPRPSSPICFNAAAPTEEDARSSATSASASSPTWPCSLATWCTRRCAWPRTTPSSVNTVQSPAPVLGYWRSTRRRSIPTSSTTNCSLARSAETKVSPRFRVTCYIDVKLCRSMLSQWIKVGIRLPAFRTTSLQPISSKR